MVEEIIFNEKDVLTLLRFFKHTKPTELRVFGGKYPKGETTFHSTEKALLLLAKSKNITEKVDIYFGGRDRIDNNDKGVISSHFIFIDIDEHEKEDKENIVRFEQFLEKNKIKYSIKGFSGAGYHYYIEHELFNLEKEEDKEKYKLILKYFFDILTKNNIVIDEACKDLSRVTRILGGFNHKRNKQSKIISFNKLDNSDIILNTNQIKTIVNGYFKSSNLKVDESNSNLSALELLKQKRFDIDHRWLWQIFEDEQPIPHGKNVNNKLFKNAALLFYQRLFNESEIKILGKELVRIVGNGRTLAQFDGWCNKVKNNELGQFTKKEINNWIDDKKLSYIKYDLRKKTIESEKVNDVYTSIGFYNDINFIYEQGYDSILDKTYFIKWDKENKTYELVDNFIIDDKIFKPITGEELSKKVVLLPTHPVKYTSEEELELEIREHIHKWLDVDEDFEQLVFYNILLSWVYDKFNTLSYTRALGDTGTGKSRFLFVLGHLHYKPMNVAGALTPAFIFRIISKWKGTLLIDEGDQNNSDEANSFIKIMNCGYEKGFPIGRCNKDTLEPEYFDIFCPKVLTTRKRFEDKATEARCMTTIMTQTFRKDIPDILTDEYFKSVEKLRNKLLMWKFLHYDSIDQNKGLEIDLSMYEPRLRQVNRSFISLFAHNPAYIEKFKKNLDKYQENLIEERGNSFEGIIINSLAELIAINDGKPITPNCIKEYTESKNIQLKYPITTIGISKILRGMGVIFKRFCIDKKTQNCLIFDKKILAGMFSRYVFDESTLLKLRKLNYDITGITNITVSMEERADISHIGKQTPSQIKKETDMFTELSTNRNNRNLENLRNFNSDLSQSLTREDILFHIERFGTNGKILIEQLLDDLSITEEVIIKLKQSGDLIESPAGWVKRG